MANRPKTRTEWREALHFIHQDRTARPGSPERRDPTSDAEDERLGHALEQVRAIMIEVGADGRSVYVSPSITAVLGYSPEEFAATLEHIAEGRLGVEPLITGKVGVDDVPGAFEELASPERHAKILVEPWR